MSQKINTNIENLQKRWAMALPPLRPSAADLKVYRKLLKHCLVKDGVTNVLVLGAVPEIRDLLGRFYTAVTVVGGDKKLVKALTSLRRSQSRETIVIAPWQRIPLSNKYDVVIGDLALNLLPPRSSGTVLIRIAKLLRAGGHFIHRTMAFHQQAPVALVKLLADWRRGKINTSEFWWLTSVYSNLASFDRKRMVNQERKFIQLMQQLYEDKILTRSEMHKLDRFALGIDLAILPQKQWEQMLSQYFIIKKITKSDNLQYSRDIPIWLTKLK